MIIISLQTIKHEAVYLFAEKGYEGTSIKDITSLVGITPPGFYAHFSSKEELFFEILKECLADRREDVRRIVEKSDGRFCGDILYEMYLSYIRYYMQKNYEKTFILRNVLFPPNELREKILSIIMDHINHVNGLVACVLKACMDEKTIIDMPLEEHLRKLNRLVYGYLFEIKAFNKDIDSKDIEKEWDFYWSTVKKKK